MLTRTAPPPPPLPPLSPQGEIPALSSLPAPWGPRPGKRDPARAPKTWPTPPSVDVGGVVAAK
jgi:hypothetical protein